MKHGRITRVHPDGRKETVAEPGGSPNGLAIGPDGALYVCNSGGWDFDEIGDFTIPHTELPAHHSGGRIERVDLDDRRREGALHRVRRQPADRSERLVFDAHGGMWFTDHGRREGRVQHIGAIYYAQPDGSSIREVVFPSESPNGIGLSPDGTRLYVGRDPHRARVRVERHRAGRGRAARPRAPTGAMLCGLPGMQLFDSLGVDGDGNVVVATLVTGALTVISPAGEVLDQVLLGDPMVTNVCFGGADLRTAYATLSATGRLVSFAWPRPGLELNY